MSVEQRQEKQAWSWPGDHGSPVVGEGTATHSSLGTAAPAQDSKPALGM